MRSLRIAARCSFAARPLARSGGWKASSRWLICVDCLATRGHGTGPYPAMTRAEMRVKAGRNISVAMVRDLGHVVQREHAQIGVLITMTEPTQPMRTEAASVGFYHSSYFGRDYPRLQIRTVAELLAGNGIDYPGYWRRQRHVQEHSASRSQPASSSH